MMRAGSRALRTTTTASGSPLNIDKVIHDLPLSLMSLFHPPSATKLSNSPPCPFEIGIDKVIATTLRSLYHWDVALFRPLLQPALKLLGNVPEHMPAHRIKLPVGIEEADDAFGLLERLNQTVQQDAIEATVLPSNAALVVSAKGVHEQPPADPRQPDSAAHSPPIRKLSGKGISRAEPLASWTIHTLSWCRGAPRSLKLLEQHVVSFILDRTSQADTFN